jgi:HEAT repeat protein
MHGRAALYVSLFGLFAFLPPPGTTRPSPPQEVPEEAAFPVQLEEPPEEVQLGRNEVRAKEGAESEWVDSGNPESIPLLLRYLRGDEEIVQFAALAEFASMGAKARPAVPAILDALRDPKSFIRVEAAATLIHLNAQSKAAVRTLTEELKAEEGADRAWAARVIGQLVSPEEVLGTCCWGPDPPPRVARPWVGKRTLPALVKALEDREPKVRAQAAHTLGLIGHAAKPAAPALAQALTDEDAAVREAAVRSLKRVDPGAAARAGIESGAPAPGAARSP